LKKTEASTLKNMECEKNMLINGCQEGKGTPRLTEVKCPKCGEYVEVFVLMGGPIGKTGTAEDVAKAFAYLAEAEFVTGQVLGVNGGLII